MGTTDQQVQQEIDELYAQFTMEAVEPQRPAAAAPAPAAPVFGVEALVGMQAQGDLIVIPLYEAGGHPVVGGYELVTGAKQVTVLATKHEHVLVGHGNVRWAAAREAGADLGLLIVPIDGTALLEHTDNHAPIAMGPGTYVVRRQRVFVDDLPQVEPETPPAQRHREAAPFVDAPSQRRAPRPGTTPRPGFRLVWD